MKYPTIRATIGAIAVANLALLSACGGGQLDDEPKAGRNEAELGKRALALSACTASDEDSLRAAVARFRSEGCSNNRIDVLKNIVLSRCDAPHGLALTDLNNLTLQGSGGRWMLTANPACVQAYGGVIGVTRGSNIALFDLSLRKPAGAERRALVVDGTNNANVQRLTITSDANPDGTAGVALLMNSVTGAWIEGVGIDGGHGGGIVLRDVRNFKVFNNAVTNLRNGGAGQNVAIQVSGSSSAEGNIANNWIANVPSQGIFVEQGNYITVRGNRLTNIANRAGNAPDGGRAIYLNSGAVFWVVGNVINGVDGATAGTTRNGGGINAGNCGVSDLIIEGNEVYNAGNSGGHALSAGAETIGPLSGGYWNGYGVRVRSAALVRDNIINSSSTYGVLIMPGADKVSVVGNREVRYSGINNIKAVSGNGSGACQDGGNTPVGPLTRVEIRDNFVADARRAGINVEPTAGNNSYAVSLMTNSLHRNDGGQVGALMKSATGGVWARYAPLPAPAWIGQNPYLRDEPGVVAGAQVSNDFSYLRSTINSHPYMTWVP